MNDKYKKLCQILGEGRVLVNESLFQYSSFHLGGPADLFLKAKTISELVKAISACRNLGVPYFILGGGSNLLISDSGFKGLVIKNETNGIRLVGVRGGRDGGREGRTIRVHTVYLEAESGVGVNRLVRFTLEQGLAGLEAFLGQPGTVGGSVFINSHNMKLGRFIGDVLFEAKLLNAERKIKQVPRSYFKFGYDQSAIQKTNEVVLSATFKLTTDDGASLWEKARQAYTYRRQTQPQGVFSSGCIFRNISKSDAVRLTTPNYTCSAGYILDNLGLKGAKVGGASFALDHANFIIHQGNASAKDVFELMKLAKRRAKDKFGIDFQEEIVLVGEF